MGITVEFEYGKGQRVCIGAINTIGTVDAMLIDRDGCQYRVVYWNDGIRHSVWLYSWELRDAGTPG